MWPVVIVVVSPVFDDDSGFEEVGEVFDFEAFVASDVAGRSRYSRQRSNPLARDRSTYRESVSG